MQHARFSHKSGEKGKRSPRACHVIISPTQKKGGRGNARTRGKIGEYIVAMGHSRKGRRVESLCTAKRRRQPSVFSLVCTVFVWKGEGKEEQVSINWIIDGGIWSGLQVLLQSTKALRRASEEERDCTFEWGGRGEPNMATISTSVSFFCCNIIEYAFWPSNMGIRDQLNKNKNFL